MKKIIIIFMLILSLVSCSNKTPTSEINKNETDYIINSTDNTQENSEHIDEETDKTDGDESENTQTNNKESENEPSKDNNESQTPKDIVYINGVPHIRRLMSANPATSDSGCPSYDLRKMYAMSDIVFTAKVVSYDADRFDSTVYFDVDYVPMTVEITNVIKGSDATVFTTTDAAAYFEFGYSGAPMTLAQYQKYVRPDFDVTLYPENTVVDCSFGSKELPQAETEYLFFIKEFEDHLESEITPGMRHAILGNNDGLKTVS